MDEASASRTSGSSDGRGVRARIERRDARTYCVQGPMTFDSVSGLWSESRGLFSAGDRLQIDLSEVSHTDSAGLALLVEWLREATRLGGSLSFSNLPAQLLAIAGASNLERLLGVEKGTVHS